MAHRGPREPAQRAHGGADGPASPRGHPHARALSARLERLAGRTAAFWVERAPADVGFHLHHGTDGRDLGLAPLRTVTQARTTWAFARLAESPLARSEHRQLAAHGVAHLLGGAWDHEHGGVHWEVAADGTTPIEATKHLYAQAFATFALATAGRVLGDPRAVGAAAELARRVDRAGARSRLAGGGEALTPDWRPGGATVIATPGDAWTSNTAVHLLEAAVAVWQATGADDDRERVEERLGDLEAYVEGSSLRLAVRPDGTPHPDLAGAGSLGHDVEAAWMGLAATRAIGLPLDRWAPTARSLWAGGRRGLRPDGHLAGRRGLAVRRGQRVAVWWVQAEALLAAAWAWRLAGDDAALADAEALCGWLERVGVDPGDGGWFAEVDRRGRPSGLKAGPWKGPYHELRALLDGAALLGGGWPPPPLVPDRSRPG